MTELHEERLEVILAHLVGSGARTVLDLGCGPGELLVRLASRPDFERIVGLDVSPASIAEARSRLEERGDGHPTEIELVVGSFMEPNKALAGFDAAVMLETIEHIDPDRLSRVERAVFHNYRPGLVLVTTPNVEYNPLHGMAPGQTRHPDHRFEWDRARFRRWSRGVAKRSGYRVAFGDVGLPDPARGASTQMAIFKRITD